MTRRPKLPPVPTGFEIMDLRWSQLIPLASAYVAILPESPDATNASPQGIRCLAALLEAKKAAQTEMQRTPAASTVRLVRHRNLMRLEKQFQERALDLVGALVARARAAFPKARPAQLLTVARNDFKRLLTESFPRSDA
jgi:hypothetical protein